jgi:capsular polysaccharide transport system permease protein
MSALTLQVRQNGGFMLLFTSIKPPLQRVQRVLQAVRRVNVLFLVTVVVPVTVAAVYYGMVASDIYVSESRFVLRSQQQQQSSGLLGNLISGVGMSKAQDEAYTVHDFILSRDALRRLDQTMGVRRMFADENIDRLSRFPGLHWDESFEGLYRYYPKRVTATYDTTSSIMTLQVSAFTPQDAQRINERLLAMSEELVNQLNRRALADSIRFATSVVEEAEAKAKQAALALSTFRTRRSVFDPEKQSAMQLAGVAKLQEELIATRTQLVQVKQLTADNPQIPVLEARVATLQREIEAEMRKIAGGNVSLTTQASEYERLALERGFAEKQLASALASLELARNEAQKKQLYLERIVQPNLPDTAIEPRRVRSVLVVLAVALVAWAILGLLLASVREHRE